MPSPEYDLRYIEAGIEQLEEYLLSDIVYWPIGVRPPPGDTAYPKLTIGGILLALARAKVTIINAEQKPKYNRFITELNSMRSRWSLYWDQKSALDYKARLTLWRNYIEDYQGEPVSHFDRYRYESRRRVQLELLSHETKSIQKSSLDLLHLLDMTLKSFFISGVFIWEKILMSGFPPEPFWYLYGSVPRDLKSILSE